MGRSPCCIKEGLKKGPWTQDEDQKLMGYVKEHGHGNWRTLPQKCGLLRCGKSCRLRWTNYLRPDIKRGLFTQSEEQKIIQLHSLVGNKWAFIASQLPRRTDNEIKNYWNTVLKKRLQKLDLATLGTTPTRTQSTLSTAAAAEWLMQLETPDSIKSSASKKLPSCNTCSDKQSINAGSSPASTHLAQWESARLEAEARLSKHSQSSKTHKLLSSSYMGHTFSTPTTATAFSSLSHNRHTNPLLVHQLPNTLLSSQHTCTSSTSNPCLIHHHSPTINYLSPTSSLSLPAIVSLPSTCSASNTSSASSDVVSSKSLSSLSSQESIALLPSGRLSWQAEESTITPSSVSSTSQLSFISQMLFDIDRHDENDAEKNTSTKGDVEPSQLRIIRENIQQMSLEAASSVMDLNSTIMENPMDLNSAMDTWHDFIFDVENSCSEMVSTNWRDPLVPSSQTEELSHDTTSNTPKTSTQECLHTALQAVASNVQENGSLDMEGLNLIHLDCLLSCEQHENQHIKELVWDIPPAVLSVTSASFVN